MKTCLHRLFTTTPVNIGHNPKGCGDCHICTSDEKNKECSRYTPISVLIIDIEQSASFFTNKRFKHL